MKIYTKTGDAGETGLYGNVRVPKDHGRIWVYGTLDETNAALGMALSQLSSQPSGQTEELKAPLTRIQAELFELGAELATPAGKKTGQRLIQMADVERLEQEIDSMEAHLSPLKSFILPGGTSLASHLHLARCILRRAERELIGLNRLEPQRSEVLRYLNRLSDYLFVCARFANHLAGISDVPWTPRS